jgi:glycosyltransferase involved in cell wall biosynthesis
MTISASSPIRLVIVTDAWKPQVNGVVTTLGKTRDTAEKLGHQVHVINPSKCRTIPCPTYPEIRLALGAGKHVKKQISDFQPTHIHISTEGPLGLAARKYCIKNNLAFTTSYHTQFPEYIRERFPIPLSLSYKFFRRFHSKATRTMVGTPHQRKILQDRGFKNISLWTRGVDTDVFRPKNKDHLRYSRPIWIYVGRVAVEKNIEAFLSLDLPGTKVVIGDGPATDTLLKKYSDVKFEGYKFGEQLASHIASGDVFVFPSLTDTFGVVMLEAMACGLPVAAFPVTGPRDVVRNGTTGILNEDLKTAALEALQLNPQDCINQALEYTWEQATLQFINNLTLATSA